MISVYFNFWQMERVSGVGCMTFLSFCISEGTEVEIE
jgi:hypothetical protein